MAKFNNKKNAHKDVPTPFKVGPEIEQDFLQGLTLEVDDYYDEYEDYDDYYEDDYDDPFEEVDHEALEKERAIEELKRLSERHEL